MLVNTPRWIVPLIAATVLTTCSVQRKTEKQPEHMELGTTTRAAIETPQYPWFDTSYSVYQPKSEMLEDMDAQLDSLSFLVVFGTWCSDSKREVPRFFKILDRLKFPTDRITMYGVDRSIKSPQGIPQQFHITKVPTIVVLHGGTEIGRIIESPKTTLEFDLMEILSSIKH